MLWLAIFWFCRKQTLRTQCFLKWCHNIKKKIARGEVFSISFTKISCCLQKITQNNKFYAFDSCLKRTSPQDQGKPNLHCIIAWKVRFIPSPAPLGAGSVACADVPWRCLCEILGSAQARGAGALSCSPEQAVPKAWPSCTAAQPLTLLNPSSLWLWLPLLSHFSPPHSYLLLLPSPQLPNFSLHSAFPRFHTNEKHFPSRGGKHFCSNCALGKIHHQLLRSVEPKCPKEVPFFDSLWLSSDPAPCCTWSRRNDCQCIISECNYIIIYPLKEYNPPITTYMRKTTWNKLWMW